MRSKFNVRSSDLFLAIPDDVIRVVLGMDFALGQQEVEMGDGLARREHQIVTRYFRAVKGGEYIDGSPGFGAVFKQRFELRHMTRNQTVDPFVCAAKRLAVCRQHKDVGRYPAPDCLE